MLTPENSSAGFSFSPPSVPTTVAERVELINFLARSDNEAYQQRLAWMCQNLERLLTPASKEDLSAAILIPVIVTSLRVETCVDFGKGTLDPSLSPLLEKLELRCREHLSSFSASELSRIFERRFPTGKADPSLPMDMCQALEQKATFADILIACCSVHARGETPSPIALSLLTTIAPRLHECSNQQLRLFIDLLRRGYHPETPHVDTCMEILRPNLHTLSSTQALNLYKGTRKSVHIDQRIADCLEEHLHSRGQTPPGTQPRSPRQRPLGRLSLPLLTDEKQPSNHQGYLTHQELDFLGALANKALQETAPHAELSMEALRALQRSVALRDPREAITWGTLVARCHPQFLKHYQEDLPLHRELLQALPFAHLASTGQALRALPNPERTIPLKLLTQVLIEKYELSPTYPIDWVADLLPFAPGGSVAQTAHLEAPLRERIATAGHNKQVSIVIQLLRWPDAPRWARALAQETVDNRLDQISPSRLRTLAHKFSWLCSEYPELKAPIVTIFRNSIARRDSDSAWNIRTALKAVGFRTSLLTENQVLTSAKEILLKTPADPGVLSTFFLELQQLSDEQLQNACREISGLVDTVNFQTTLLATAAMQRVGFHARPALRPLYLTFENRCIGTIVDELKSFKVAMPTLPDYAFARVIRVMGSKGYRDLTLCDDIVRETIKRAPRLDPKFFATIADSLGRLRIENIEFWTCFADHASRNWEAYKADRIASASIWALGVYAPHLVSSVCTPAKADGIEKHSTWLKVYHALLLSTQAPPTSYPPRYHELMREFTFAESSPSEIQFGANFPRALQLSPSRVQSKVVVGGYETDWVVDLTSRRLIIELDGEIHFLCGPDGQGLLNGRDILQDKIFQIFGYETFHFPASALKNPVKTAQVMHELALTANRIRKQFPPNGARRIYLQ